MPGRHTYCPPAPMSHEAAALLPALPFSPIATTLGVNVTIYGKGTGQALALGLSSSSNGAIA